MPAGAVSLVGLVNPVVGTLLGVAFAGEVFGWPQAVGMALVLGGVVAGQRYGSRPASPVVPEPVVEPSGTGRERAMCAA
jgi:probable blue pigment (indigoidine) exporter